jgi:hypothetical protein
MIHEIICVYIPMGGSAMDSMNVFKRYEKKFIMTSAQAEALLPIIRAHMSEDPFCVNGQSYLVRNIYWDTEDDDLIRQSVEHPPYKEKLRVRKYGTYETPNPEVYIEIKKKIEGIVTKRRMMVTPQEADDFLYRKIFPIRQEYESQQIIREIAYFLSRHEVTPKVFISYERLAFYDKTNPEFRLTYDLDIRSRRHNLRFDTTSDGERIMPEHLVLMEIKVHDAVPLWFAHALSDLHIYVGSFSKYGKEFEMLKRKGLTQHV